MHAWSPSCLNALVTDSPHACLCSVWVAQVGELLGKSFGDAAPESMRMLRVPWIEVRSHAGPLSANRDGEPVEPSST